MLKQIFFQISTVCLSSALLISGANLVEAATFNFSSVGTWGNTTDGLYIGYWNVDQNGVWSSDSQTTGENQVRWGYPIISPYANYQSGLGFTGVQSATANLGQIFSIGTLRHFNHPIFGGTASSAAEFFLSLDFGAAGTRDFNFLMAIDETPNVEGSCVYDSVSPCADRISFANTTSLSQAFSVGGQNYLLNILGFSNSPSSSPINQLISQEDGISQTYIYGQISEVPEPLTMTATGLSLISMAWFRRKRQAQ